jgi:hypothetical protein
MELRVTELSLDKIAPNPSVLTPNYLHYLIMVRIQWQL